MKGLGVCAGCVVVSLMFGGCIASPVENQEAGRVSSPDGKRVAVWYYRGAGATTNTSTGLVVYDSGETASNPVMDVNPLIIFDEKLEPLPALTWGDAGQLMVSVKGIDRSRVFIKATERHGVRVELVDK